MVSVEQNSILKKISAVILLITALVFFSFNVFATTYNPTTYNTYTDAITVSNVTYSLRVTQFKALSEGTSMLPGGMETIMFVQFQVTNDNDQDALCQIPVFSIDLSDERVITDVYTYAGDLALGVISTGFVIYPTQEFSYDASNKIVVPANSTLTLVGGIGLPAQLNQTGDGTLDTGLRNVHLLNKPYTVTLGSYAHGTPIDVSPIVNYLEDIIDNQDTINDNLDDILTAINTISDEITYSGAAYNPNNTSSAYVQNIDSTYQLDDVTMYVSRYIGPSYYLSNDIELDNGNDVIVHTGTRVIPVIYRIVFSNESTKYLRLRYTNSINEFFPSGTYSYEITTIQNDMMYGFLSNGLPTSATNRRCHYYVRDTIGNYGYIAPKTRDVTIIYMNVYVNDTGSVSWGNPTLRFTADPTLVDNVYHPNTVYQLLLDWFNSYKSVNGVDDSSDISNDVADVSDSNHVIEENYYSANASAIEATGLSNYRFSNEQNNGIGQVSSDFMLLWNALGSWNGVYIFSLTMALATFIMRHGGLFTIKRETSDKGGDGD